MRQPRCPSHGFGRHLVNAGAPFVVRCTSCCVSLERCRQCRGLPSYENGRGTVTYCSVCTTTPHPGWQIRPARLNTGTPIIS